MDSPASSRDRIARHRAVQRERGLRSTTDRGLALDPEAVRRGAVVLVRLPRDKARPAVVVRSDLLAELSYATVLPITTDLRAGVSLRIDLAPSQENGLLVASQMAVVLGIGVNDRRGRPQSGMR